MIIDLSGNTSGGGVSRYSQLPDKPKINGVTLSGDKSAAELGIAAPYDAISKKGEGYYYVEYSRLDYAFAAEYFEGRAPVPNLGACSVKVAGNLVGRNYDWLRNGEALFEIHTPAAQGHHQTAGFASMSTLTISDVESRAFSDSYRLLPFYMQDGGNDSGLFCAILVAPATTSRVTVPLVEKRDRVCSTALVRYILDNYSSVDTAVDGLKNYVEIFHPTTLTEMGYEPHFLLKDGSKSVVLEFSGDTLVATPSTICTNFHINGVTFNADGSVYTNADVADSHLPSSQGIEDFGSGLERWNILNGETVTDEASMRAAMDKVLFSKAYTDTDNVWFSEFVGGDITVDTPATDAVLLARIAELRAKFADPTDETVWITKQSCVYNMNGRSCALTIREGATVYNAMLVYNIDYLLQRIEQIPTIDSSLDKDSTNTEVAGAKAAYDAANSEIVSNNNASVNFACEAGKTYKAMLSTGVTSLAFTLTAPSDNAVRAIWTIKFRSGSTATNVTWPAGLYYPKGTVPTIEANAIYELCIDEDMCLNFEYYKTA